MVGADQVILRSPSACGGVTWLVVEEWDGEEYVFEGPLGGAAKEKVVAVVGRSGGGCGPVGEGGASGGHGGGGRVLRRPPVRLVFKDV